MEVEVRVHGAGERLEAGRAGDAPARERVAQLADQRVPARVLALQLVEHGVALRAPGAHGLEEVLVLLGVVELLREEIDVVEDQALGSLARAYALAPFASMSRVIPATSKLISRCDRAR
jgi:hypothetical protein